jgi:hypothetical protein
VRMASALAIRTLRRRNGRSAELSLAEATAT